VEAARSAPPARRRGFRLGVPQTKGATAALLQGPSVVLLIAVTVFPVLYSLNLSFRSFSLILPNMTGQWIGVDNYSRLLSDGEFWHSVGLTAVFVLIGVGIELVLGIALALVIDSLTVGRRIFTSLLLIPMILTPLVIGLMYNFVFNAQFGLLTFLIRQVGIPLPDGILGNQATAFPALVLTDIWEWTPFMALIVLAGLQALPSEPVQAARVDGAGSWQILRFVKLPMLRPLIAVALLFRGAEAVKEFDKVYILTGGGPGNATEVVDLFTYRVSFANWEMSYGSALGIVLFAVSMIAGAAFFLLLFRRQGDA
jgi:multiple sugar transport system permease protein